MPPPALRAYEEAMGRLRERGQELTRRHQADTLVSRFDGSATATISNAMAMSNPINRSRTLAPYSTSRQRNPTPARASYTPPTPTEDADR